MRSSFVAIASAVLLAACGSSRSGTASSGTGSSGSTGIRVTGGNSGSSGSRGSSSGSGTTTRGSSSTGTTLGQLDTSSSSGATTGRSSGSTGGSTASSTTGGSTSTGSTSSGSTAGNTSSSSTGSTTGGPGSTSSGSTSTGSTGAGGACLSPPPDPQNIDNGDIGGPCTSYGDGGGVGCATGEYCLGPAGSSGECFVLGCDATNQTGCPGNSYCYDDGQGDTFCLGNCFPGTSGSCNGNQVCFPSTPNSNDLGLCTDPQCATADDCNTDAGTTFVCGGNGLCNCTQDSDCGSGLACDQATGVCYQACSSDPDCNGQGCCETQGGVSFCDVFASESGSGSTGTTGSGSTGSTGTTGSTGSTGSTGTSTGGSGTFFFSEYYEGKSNNKAIEVYNAGASALDLSSYQIRLFSNGAYALDAGAPTAIYAFLDAGFTTLAPHTTFLLCNSQFDAGAGQPLPPCDDANSGLSSVVNFNGDDTLLLTTSDGTVVDSFGDGTDPGTHWGSGADTTLDNDLRRLCPAVPRTNVDVDGGFDPADAGWDGKGVTALDDLGSYSCANQ